MALLTKQYNIEMSKLSKEEAEQKGASVDASLYEAGVKGQVSLISGSASVEGTGVLAGLGKISN
jgi:hypothetical protein